MNMPINVVSALPARCQAQTQLLQHVTLENRCWPTRRLDDRNAISDDHSPVLFFFPILGDNDLLPELEDAIRLLLERENGLIGRQVLVILKGDRHISDELVHKTTPVHIRLLHLLGHLTSLWISATKLDLETVDNLASDIITMLRAPVELHPGIEEMAYLLGAAPYWCKDGCFLDFFDSSSGRSLLYRQSAQILERTGELIRLLAPETLILKSGYLKHNNCLALICDSNAVNIDLGSNRLQAEKLGNLFKSCKWLSLAANDLESIDLALLPPSLTKLRLDKNRLQDIRLEALTNRSLRWLSLYRNNITQLDFPLVSMDYLNLGANPLVALPDSLYCTGLRSLGLARTRLSCLPDWIMEMPLLQTIDISYIEDNLPRSQIKHLISQKKRLITRPRFIL